MSFNEFSISSNVSKMFWLIIQILKGYKSWYSNPIFIKFYFMKPLKLSWAMTIFQELNKRHRKAPYRASCCRDDGCFCVKNWLLNDDDAHGNEYLNKQKNVNKTLKNDLDTYYEPREHYVVVIMVAIEWRTDYWDF